MVLSDVFWILFLALVPWLWWIDRGITQNAFAEVKRYCELQNVQLLDDNIQLQKISFKRNKHKKIKLFREYRFEFTSTGEHRYLGEVQLLGRSIDSIQLAAFHL